MTNFTWTSGKKGSWGNAADWAGGTVANSAAADVTIAGTTSNVTIGSANFYTVDSTTLQSGTLTIAGTLDFAGASSQLSLQSGFLDITGTLIGATLSQTGGTLTLSGATWDNVTDESPLNLTASGASLYLQGSDSFTGAGGAGPGTINLAGNAASLFLDDNTTLNGATLNFAATGGSTEIYLVGVGISQNTATFGASMDIVQSAAGSTDEINLFNDDYNATLVNLGIISAGAVGGDFEIFGPGATYGFVNRGTVAVSNGDSFNISNLGTFINTGVITGTGTGTQLDIGEDGYPTGISPGAVSVSGGALLNLGGTFSLSGLSGITIGTGGELNITGDLINTGTLTVAAGTTLSGTITGGTVMDAGGSLIVDGGEVNGVTYEGTLGLSSASSRLYLTGADNFAGANGAGPGTINLTGNGADLFVENLTTLTNAKLNLGTTSGSAHIYIYDVNGGGDALTLGSGMNVVQSAKASNVGIDLSYEGYNNNTLVNQGTIAANAAGGVFNVYGPSGYNNTFANQGSILISNGDTFEEQTGTFINTGVIIATGAGTVLDLAGYSSSYGNFINIGIVSVSSGAELNLGATFGLSALSGVTFGSGAALNIAGDLLNTGTLAVGASTALGTVTLSGTITGGTVLDAGGNLIADGGELDGVTYDGTLNLTAASAQITLAGTNDFAGPTGTGPGTINLTGNGAHLFVEYVTTPNVEQLTTLNNAAINLGGSSSTDSIILYDPTGGYNELVFGGNMNLVQSAKASDVGINLGDFGYGKNTLVNLGTIAASAASGDFYITGYYNDQFSNQGSLIISNGDVLNISNAGTFTNLAGTTLTGGAIFVGAGSTLQLAANSKITTDAASITLSGAGSAIQSQNSTTSAEISLDSKLASIATTGTLDLLAGRSFAAAAASFTDSGLLGLSAATFSAAALSITSTGTLAGAGTVKSAITSTGAIIATGGSLLLTGALSGAGGVSIAVGADLTLGTAASGGAITFAGTGAKLTLDAPASVGEQLVSLAPSDTIDLAGLTATSAIIMGGSLVISLSAGGTLQDSLAAANPADRLALSSDGHGGTNITVFGDAAPTISPTTTNFGEQHAGALLTQFYTIGNQNVFGAYQENLDAGFAGGSGGVSGGGSVNISVQATSSNAVSATLSATTGGLVSGTGTIDLDTNGTGIDGLGTLALPPEIVTLTGTIFNYATALGLPGTIAFGQHHAGDTVSDTMVLANSAAAGPYSENLDAAFSGTTLAAGSFSTGGTVTGLAGHYSSTALAVTLGTGAGGAVAGAAFITLVSDGAGIDTLGTTSLGVADIAVTGAVFNYATAALTSASVAFGNIHAGGAASQNVTLTNQAAAGLYSENLDAGFAGASPGIFTGGTVSELAAGGSQSSLNLGIGGQTAGQFTGAATLALTSDGAGIDTLGTTALAGRTIGVSATVWDYATASLASENLDLGIIHAGDAGTATLSLANISGNLAYTEGLDAAFIGTSGALTAGGAVSLLAAGGTDNADLVLTLATGGTGIVSGSATLGLTSDGALTSGLGTTALGDQIVTLTGTVDNYATLGVVQLAGGGGSLTASGTDSYVLNLGTVTQGAAALSAFVGIENSAVGAADELGGSFALEGSTSAFTNNGPSGFSGITAGDTDGALFVTLSSTAAGSFTEELVIDSYGTNASGYSGTLTPVTVTITGSIASTAPELFTLTTHADHFIGTGSGSDVFIAASNCLSAGDTLIGGGGVNTLSLSGGGTFDMTQPDTLANIAEILATEAKGKAAQTITLRAGFTGTLTAASGAAGSGITIHGNNDSATIILGNGKDIIYVGSDSEVISTGTGSSVFSVTSATAGATIAAGAGANTLAVSGGGAVAMGAAITGVNTALISDAGVFGTEFTANADAKLVIDAGAGADTILLGAAKQSVISGGGTMLIEGAIGDAAATITNTILGAATLALTTSGTATLNTNDTDLIVNLSTATNLTLNKMGFITGDGTAGHDTITAKAANQTLIGGSNDTLIGYTGFGDLFSGTAAALTGDTIRNFGGTDLIDLTNFSLTAAKLKWSKTAGGGDLTITGGGNRAVIDFTGTYSAASFSLSSDGTTGTYVHFV